MRKKNVIRLLRNADQEIIEQISREYPGLTDTEREDLFCRIEQTFQAEDNTPTEEEERFSITHEPRIARVFPAVAAAACILMLCTTFAGLFWMKDRMQPPPDTETMETTETVESEDVADLAASEAYSIGERYAAANLTQSGTLWMTVTEAEPEDDLYRIRITLESEQAVSLADQVMGEPYLFMADNFMAATGNNGENWVTVQPCKLTCSGELYDLPNTIWLYPDETQELTLWFRQSDLTEEFMVVTNHNTAYSYTAITMKED